MDGREPVGHFLRSAQAYSQHTLLVSLGNASSRALRCRPSIPVLYEVRCCFYDFFSTVPKRC